MQLFSCELTGFITCSIINRRTLPIKGTVQELAIHHPLSAQKLQVLLCLSLWHQAAVRLDGLDLLGKKTLMSMFKMVVESVSSRQLSPTTHVLPCGGPFTVCGDLKSHYLMDFHPRTEEDTWTGRHRYAWQLMSFA